MNTLHITETGSGPPLILLHGWGWHSGIWQQLLSQLTEKHTVFCIDLPGFGKSQNFSRTYDFHEILPKILDSLPQKASWLGWSMGGLFAYWVAIHFPERVNTLITVASTPRFTTDQDWPGIEPLVLKKFSNHLNTNIEKTLLEFLHLQLRGCTHQEKILNTLQHQYQQYEPCETALQGGLVLLENTDFRNHLTKIKCPNFHIFGQRDTIVKPQVAALLPQLLSCETYIIKQSGHMPFITHSELFLNVLNQFLS